MRSGHQRRTVHGGVACSAVGVVLTIAGLALAASLARAEVEPSDDEQPAYETRSLQGRVVWLDEALQRRYGVETDPAGRQTIVALDALDGALYPIVQDGRGRGFHLDPRMRDVEMELLVRQYEGSPVVQVIRVFTLKEDGRYEFDYWCDICAIPMYELKPCECCQQEIRIRERRVDADGEPIDAAE